jgi:acyl carrier protein
MSTDETVRQILETVLGESLEGIENPSREQYDRWDSLARLEIVFLLEEQFGGRFSAGEVASMNSLSEIVTVLQAKQLS